jgi:5'-nucleotidase
MIRILVTNDDGVRSKGIRALAAALEPLGQVVTVAPTREVSAIGHALTLHHPLRLEHLRDSTYALDGTPTDCVNIAVAAVLKGLPDLVVSGINKGLNVGDDVTYSGTVSGALEAALLGVPAVAVSLQQGPGEWDFGDAARVTREIAALVLGGRLPRQTFLNVNVPRRAPLGIRVTTQGKRNHATTVTERHDPRGRPYYWIGEGRDEWIPDGNSDHEAVHAGYVSVTPLHSDLTAYHALDSVKELGVENALR